MSKRTGCIGGYSSSRLEVGEEGTLLCTMAEDFVAQGKPELTASKGETLWEFPSYDNADGWKRVRNQEGAIGIVPAAYCKEEPASEVRPTPFWKN